MKNSFKLLRTVLLVVLTLLLVIVVTVRIFGGRAVKMGIETAATKTLNVGVSVDDVDLSIFGGRIGFENLSINNPPGYKYDKLLELKDAGIEVEIK